jgi:hypothetical protein
MESTSPVISFSGTYTSENARMARWALRRHDKRGLLGVVVGVLLVLLPFVADPPIRGLAAVLIFACGLANLYLFMVRPEIQTGKNWKVLKQAIPVSGSLSESGFEIHWKGSESRASWSDFQNGRVAGPLILFEDITGRPYYLPKSFFATDQDWSRAGEQIASWAPKRHG